MATDHERIEGRLREFVEAQQLYFVASAPLSGDGLVNLSPKGDADTFLVVDEKTVAYLDLTGSGVETIAHVRENGRITIMFAALDGPPNIVRLYGRARIVTQDDDDWLGWRARFPDRGGVRSVVVVDVQRITDSCGFGVPKYEYVGDRDLLASWAANRTPEQIRGYHEKNNATSLDGLPGIR